MRPGRARPRESEPGVTTAPGAPTTVPGQGGSSRAWGYLRSNPTFWIGAIGVTLIIGAAIFAPLIAPHDPNFQYRGEGLTPGGDPLGPTAKFPLGTDKLGRDELSRLLYGARTSLTVGIVANSLAIFIGVLVGTVGGLLSWAPDAAVRRRSRRQRADPARDDPDADHGRGPGLPGAPRRHRARRDRRPEPRARHRRHRRGPVDGDRPGHVQHLAGRAVERLHRRRDGRSASRTGG